MNKGQTKIRIQDMKIDMRMNIRKKNQWIGDQVVYWFGLCGLLQEVTQTTHSQTYIVSYRGRTIVSLFRYCFFTTMYNPQYIVSYQDNHIIINWLLPYLFITMNRWDHLDHFSQNLTFLLQSTLSKKSTFCFCRSRIRWTAPIHNSFVLWRCMWKELAPLDQPSTKCRKMIFQGKVKF